MKTLKEINQYYTEVPMWFGTYLGDIYRGVMTFDRGTSAWRMRNILVKNGIGAEVEETRDDYRVKLTGKVTEIMVNGFKFTVDEYMGKKNVLGEFEGGEFSPAMFTEEESRMFPEGFKAVRLFDEGYMMVKED